MTKITQPSILAGFMELLPEDQIQFNRIKEIVQRNYEDFGFLPQETPILEKSEVLLTKEGGETERQVYRFEKGSNDISMRFDLTVPLARYTAQYYSELSFPFRRYQIGKVYRGERNQRGRYREFYQADIDIIGDTSLDILSDAEIPTVIYKIFKEIDIGKFTIRLNNRKILNGFYKSLGVEDTQEVLRQVDKLDKIGPDGVKEELEKIGLDSDKSDRILEFVSIDGTNTEVIDRLKALGVEDASFVEGLEEMEIVLDYLKDFGIEEDYIRFDLSIARGLDYYTGTVYETMIDAHPEIGSICSGGRYENLASNYIKRTLPGVGISIGLTRLFYQLKEAGILKEEDPSITDVLVIAFDGFKSEAIKLVGDLRREGIKVFAYTEEGRLKKKLSYADDLNIPYTILVGEDEVKSGKFALRNMKTGDQDNLSKQEIIDKLAKI